MLAYAIDVIWGNFALICFGAVSALLPALVLEPLAKRVGRERVHCYCIISMAIIYTLVAVFGAQKELLSMLMALLGIGWLSIISLPFAILSEKVDQSKMGLYMGLYNLSVVIPHLLGSIGIGLFINRADDKGLVFQISAVALAI